MAAGATYTPIATTTLGSAVNSYTFSSIPSTYTDLVLVLSNTTSANIAFFARYNGDSGTNYSYTSLLGDGSTATSGRESNQPYLRIGNGNTTFGNTILQIQNYSNTSVHKTSVDRNNLITDAAFAIVGLWRSTSAINSIQIFTNSAVTFGVGSTFTLYGIQAA